MPKKTKLSPKLHFNLQRGSSNANQLQVVVLGSGSPSRDIEHWLYHGTILSISTWHSGLLRWLSSVMMMFSMSFMVRWSQNVSYSRLFSSSTVSFCMSHWIRRRSIANHRKQDKWSPPPPPHHSSTRKLPHRWIIHDLKGAVGKI